MEGPLLFVQGMVADAHISENRNEKNFWSGCMRKKTSPSTNCGEISFALIWKLDCFCCFSRTMLENENIGVWISEWIDYICCSKIFGTVGSVDQVVYPFQGKCHVNMLGSTSLVIYFPASDTVAQTNLLDSRFKESPKKKVFLGIIPKSPTPPPLTHFCHFFWPAGLKTL